MLTLALASLAWLLSGEAINALAVLVVATPCPLILAVPVAIISGMSKSAKGGALVKDGGALEALARVRTAILDKTGTLTQGRPSIIAIRTTNRFTEAEVLGLAASLDQASAHVVVVSLIEAATEAGLTLVPPEDVAEVPGKGIEGTIGGRRVALGGETYVGNRSNGDPRALVVDEPPEALKVLRIAVLWGDRRCHPASRSGQERCSLHAERPSRGRN